MSETLTYRVPGMSCENCTAAIESEVSHAAGAASVSVDLGTKLVIVQGERLSDAELRAAIHEAGYEVDDGDA